MFIESGDLYNISSIIGVTQNLETLDYGIVMDFAKHGDMRKHLSTKLHSTLWNNKLQIAIDIAKGLNRIHLSGVMHWDLHSGNILQLSSKKTIIGDLGLSQPARNKTEKSGTTTEEKGIFGVIPYIPPEVFRGENFTMAGDIYSLGMILWELATGKPPFHDCPHDAILIMNILNGARPEIASPLIPPCYAGLIKKCWNPSPSNRPTAQEVYNDLYQFWKVLRDNKSINERLQFEESDKVVKEMLNDETTNYSTTIIHPEAVYTSRLLTAQMIDFSTELE
ncbi:hypothetical protein G9A89_003685 [Geosiphon pyriformis]|nr:hypothetical protein G9A89_003685 [Geosiphon pyriformis]